MALRWSFIACRAAGSLRLLGVFMSALHRIIMSGGMSAFTVFMPSAPLTPPPP